MCGGNFYSLKDYTRIPYIWVTSLYLSMYYRKTGSLARVCHYIRYVDVHSEEAFFN